MIPPLLHGLLTAATTSAGKVGVGVALTAAAAGGAVATDVVDIPLVESEPEVIEVVDKASGDDLGEVVEERAGDVERTEAEESEDVDVLKVGAVEADDDVDSDEDADDDDSDDPEDEDADDDSDEPEDEDEEPKNHGEVVSEFATTTDLTGCEKGQAIAALASGKDDKAEASNCKDEDEDEDEDDLGEDAEEDEDVDEDKDADEDAAEGRGNNGKANGKNKSDG